MAGVNHGENFSDIVSSGLLNTSDKVCEILIDLCDTLRVNNSLRASDLLDRLNATLNNLNTKVLNGQSEEISMQVRTPSSSVNTRIKQTSRH